MKNQFLKNILNEQLFGDGSELGIGGNTIEEFVKGNKKGKNTGKKAKKKKDKKKKKGFYSILDLL